MLLLKRVKELGTPRGASYWVASHILFVGKSEDGTQKISSSPEAKFLKGRKCNVDDIINVELSISIVQ